MLYVHDSKMQYIGLRNNRAIVAATIKISMTTTYCAWCVYGLQNMRFRPREQLLGMLQVQQPGH